MGLRFRKSVKLAKGVKLNIGKKGVGLSLGTKGARVSMNTSGRKTATLGIPGTGISYTTSLGSKKKAKTTKKTQSSKTTITCPKCKSANCDACMGVYEKTQKHSLLLDLLLICVTCGLWILVMIFRKKKPEIVQKKLYTCKDCGHSWNMD